MALNKQIYLYSVATDSFYDSEEEKIHKELLKLYKLRKDLKNKKIIEKTESFNIQNDWEFWSKSINKIINEDKDKLSHLLDERLKDNTPRTLNPQSLKDKNIITLFDSFLTRSLNLKINELTEELIVLNVFFFQVFHSLVRDGFLYNGEKYIFFTASAGQIRTKRAVFIKESSYKKIEPKIMCGLTVNDINNCGGINSNKFLAYLALCNSATDVWEDFDIDRSIVVEDFETMVEGTVDFIDEYDYKISR